MGLFEIELIRNQPQTLSHPENVSVHGESLPVESEQKETVESFGADPFHVPEHFLDLSGSHLF